MSKHIMIDKNMVKLLFFFIMIFSPSKVTCEGNGVGLELSYTLNNTIQLGAILNGDILNPLIYNSSNLQIETDIPFLSVSLLYKANLGISYTNNLNIITAAISSKITESRPTSLFINAILSNARTNFYFTSLSNSGFYFEKYIQVYDMFDSDEMPVYLSVGTGLTIKKKITASLGPQIIFDCNSGDYVFTSNLRIAKYFGFHK